MLKGAYPISGEDLMALPVKAIGPAVEFYRTALGFDLISGDESTAVLQRDSAMIGLARKPDHKPEEAGSFAFGVTDIDAHHKELDAGSTSAACASTNGTGGSTGCSSSGRPRTGTASASASRPRGFPARQGAAV